ncbi:MAG TPA: hypothetical protein VIK72_12190 [Clostridiaceae bacterium]
MVVLMQNMSSDFLLDGVEIGNHPRELTRVVKCIKYFSYWEDGDYAHAYIT